MRTNHVHLLADLFLFSYEADFIQEPLKKKDKKIAVSFNINFRYINEVLSLNNLKFGNNVESKPGNKSNSIGQNRETRTG